jgi:hypothetical protein
VPDMTEKTNAVTSGQPPNLSSFGYARVVTRASGAVGHYGVSVSLGRSGVDLAGPGRGTWTAGHGYLGRLAA